MSLIALHYKIKEKVGEGNFGTVYKIEDIATKKAFAVKIFDKISIEDIREKLNPEIMNEITKLSHTNLIKIYDYGVYQNNLYCISEYFEGENLQNFKLNDRNKKDFLQIIAQICYALGYLHSHNIIHKDLKLENVLFKRVNGELMVKVLDFGFNKIISQTETYTEGEAVAQQYLSPELLQGNPFSTKSDFYAFGIILYYLGVGTFPFSLEEIKLMAEKNFPNIIPQFPSKINPAIDPKLEDLIFQLIEVNPDLRVNNASEIIKYINKTQEKKFPISLEPSIAKQIESKSIKYNKKRTMLLKDYTDEAADGNGKIIFITGEKGIGKKESMRHLKWYLLSEDYNVFYYNCSKYHRDPFFLLSKEIYISQGEKDKQKFEKEASEKFSKFLFSSEEKSLKLTENEIDLKKDFTLVKDYIYSFSKIKPIIFFISDIDMAEKDTMDFLEFLSKDIYSYPILIAVSTYNTSLVDRIENAEQINMPFLSKAETNEYLKYLLELDYPQNFLNQIYHLSNGNQTFIKNLLISLVENRIIINKNNEWNFDVDIKKAKLPPKIDSLMQLKIRTIPKKIRNQLSKLAILQVPLSTGIIKYILNFDTSKALFFFLQQCENLEILVKDENYVKEGYYKFVYPAIRNILLNKTSLIEKKSISKKTVNYFKDKRVTKPSIMDGIIYHCDVIKNYDSIIDYQMAKAKYFFDRKDFLDAWNSCLSAVKNLEKIDTKILNTKIKECITFLMKISIIVEKCEIAIKSYQFWQKSIARDFKILWLYSKLLSKCNKYNQALKTLESAEKVASPDEINDILISKIEIYTSSADYSTEQSAELMQKISLDNLSPVQKIDFLTQKAKYQYTSAKYKEAIDNLKIAEKISQKASMPFQLGRICKLIGDNYNIQNILPKAIHYYEKATDISKSEGDIFNLGNIYSSWNMVDLKKGNLNKGIEKSKKALHNYETLQYLPGTGKVNLILAQTNYKLGKFRESNKYFKDALKVASGIKDSKLEKEILCRYSFLKLKISSPIVFMNFLHKNYPEYFKKGKITSINSLLKNYIFYLVQTGKEEYIGNILQQIENQQVDYNLEKEFMLQAYGCVERSKGNITASINYFKKAATISKTNENEYALMINYFNVSDSYYMKGDINQTKIYCDLAKSIASKNNFARWQNKARITQSKILLKNKDIHLRTILNNLLSAEKIAKEMKDWTLICESQLFIMLIYRVLRSYKSEKIYKRKYLHQITLLTRGLDKKDQQLFKENFNYSLVESNRKIRELIIPRAHISATRLQHKFLDLLHLTSSEQIKFYLEKYIKEILGIKRFTILLYEEKKTVGEFWLNIGFSRKSLESDHQPYLEKLREEMKQEYYKVGKIHYCLTPLMIKNEIVGMIILSDNGELPFTKTEKLTIKLSSFYLTIILKKIEEYNEILEQSKQLSNLLTISRDILQIMDLEELENQITLSALQFTGAERGFFIALDENNNFMFNAAFLKSGERIEKTNLEINKEILKDVYDTGMPFTYTTAGQKASYTDFDITKNYSVRSVPQTKSCSIYCAPIKVNKSIFGFLYLDNLGSKQITLKFNERLLEIFLLAIETSIKNSLDYRELCKANEELLKVDQERADFINISSHEFNTPIQILKGYLSILKDEDISPKIKANTLRIMENNINRLIHSINNTLQMNVLEKSTSKLEKEWLDIKDILKIVYDEIKVLSDRRKQKLTLKIAKDIKPVYAERICLINAVKNLVLNAIKFTDDYGEIIIGARTSKFKNEKINNKDSLIIYVQDNGIGIPSYELKNIFKEFYEVADIKAHHSGLTEFKSSGLGLGLPVTKSIVELFGGKIWAESVKEEGSTFFIALPLSNDET